MQENISLHDGCEQGSMKHITQNATGSLHSTEEMSKNEAEPEAGQHRQKEPRTLMTSPRC